jgi:hypothetical protein
MQHTSIDSDFLTLEVFCGGVGVCDGGDGTGFLPLIGLKDASVSLQRFVS